MNDIAITSKLLEEEINSLSKIKRFYNKQVHDLRELESSAEAYQNTIDESQAKKEERNEVFANLDTVCNEIMQEENDYYTKIQHLKYQMSEYFDIESCNNDLENELMQTKFSDDSFNVELAITPAIPNRIKEIRKRYDEINVEYANALNVNDLNKRTRNSLVESLDEQRIVFSDLPKKYNGKIDELLELYNNLNDELTEAKKKLQNKKSNFETRQERMNQRIRLVQTDLIDCLNTKKLAFSKNSVSYQRVEALKMLLNYFANPNQTSQSLMSLIKTMVMIEPPKTAQTPKPLSSPFPQRVQQPIGSPKQISKTEILHNIQLLKQKIEQKSKQSIDEPRLKLAE